MSNIRVNNFVVNGGGNPIMLQGLAAAIPVAGIIGRLYVATDTLVIYRDNGSVWEVVGGGGSGTPSLQDVCNVSSFFEGLVIYTADTTFTNSYIGFGSNNPFYLEEGVFIFFQNAVSGDFAQFRNVIKFEYGDTNEIVYSILPKKGGTFAMLSDLPTVGTYTPSATVTTGTVTTITPDVAKYTVVGNLVTVYGAIYLLPNLATPPSLLIFTLSLPIPAKTGAVANTVAGNGVAAGGASSASSLPFVIDLNVGAGEANCFLQGISNNVYGVKYSFMYEID